MSVLVNPYRLTPPAFDPLTAAAWHSAVWASGPEFQALGLADAGTVATVPDEVSARVLTTSGTPLPKYRAAATDLNAKPALDADTNFSSQRIGSSVAFTLIPQPFTFVFIGRLTALAEGGIMTAHNAADGQGPQLHSGSAGQFAMYAGGSEVHSGMSRDTLGHLFVVYFDGAASTITVDGTLRVTGNPGTNGAKTFLLFHHAGGGYARAMCAFAAIKAAALSAPEAAALLTWSRSYYATP